MRPHTTGEVIRRYFPWVLLVGSGIGWGLFAFERHIRADQHKQDMEMFRVWIADHIQEVKADSVEANK